MKSILIKDINEFGTLSLEQQLTLKEKATNIKELITGRRRFFNKKKVKTNLGMEYIDKHDCKVGDDINLYQDIPYVIESIESIDKGDIEEEGGNAYPIINPITKGPKLLAGRQLYRGDFLIPEALTKN